MLSAGNWDGENWALKKGDTCTRGLWGWGRDGFSLSESHPAVEQRGKKGTSTILLLPSPQPHLQLIPLQLPTKNFPFNSCIIKLLYNHAVIRNENSKENNTSTFLKMFLLPLFSIRNEWKPQSSLTKLCKLNYCWSLPDLVAQCYQHKVQLLHPGQCFVCCSLWFEHMWAKGVTKSKLTINWLWMGHRSH